MNIKRQRGRGRGKPTNHNPNRAYESTGPDIKVRGSAQTILEKYQQSGRDAMASGDRVLAENYMQHAEHYLRLLKSIQPQFVPRSELSISGLPSDNEDELENGEALENENAETENDAEVTEPRENRNWRERGERNDRNNRNNRNNNRYDRNERNNERSNERSGERNERNNNRDRYRNRNQDIDQTEETDGVPTDDSEKIYANNEIAEINNTPNEDAIEENAAQATEGDDDKPRRRNTRLRSPLGRRTRTPRRTDNEEEETSGFGDNAPAFLSASPTSADA